jgi:anti-repressor protein
MQNDKTTQTPGNLGSSPASPSLIFHIQAEQVGSELVQTVNARDMHEFLESRKDFSSWIKDRIQKYGFVENQDFVVRSPDLESGNNQGLSSFQPGGNRKEYHLSLGMAKELSMVERNARGKQARQYFIECERRLKLKEVSVVNPPRLTRMQLIGMAMQAEQERLVLEMKVEVMQPKVDALDRILTFSDGSLCVTDAAKHLQLAPKKLFLWLQVNKWIYRRAGGNNWIGHQDRIQSGLVEHKVGTVERTDGTKKIVEQARITAKGLAMLAEKFESRAA